MEPEKPPPEASTDAKVVNNIVHNNYYISESATANFKNVNAGSGNFEVNSTKRRKYCNAGSDLGDGARFSELQMQINLQSCGKKLAEILRTKAFMLLQANKREFLLPGNDVKPEHYNIKKYVEDSRCEYPIRFKSISVDYKHLFDEAAVEATEYSGKYCSTLKDKEIFVHEHEKIVLLVGQAGVGKSTLAKCILDKILYEGLYDIDYIFYLDCQAIDFTNQNKTDCLEFLSNNPLIHETYRDCSVELKQVFEMLHKSDKVGVILDGVDKEKMCKYEMKSGASASRNTQRPFLSSIHDRRNAETFLYNLFNGNILPRAKKLITSRFEKSWEMSSFFCEHYLPHFVVKVMGLNETGQSQICSYVCEQKESNIKKVMQHLNEHSNLKSYCSISFHCVVIMFCVHQSFQDNVAARTADSITQIFVAALDLFIKNRTGQLCGEVFQTKELCALAYSGFYSDSSEFCPDHPKIDFEDHELKKGKIGGEIATTFLTTCMSKALNLKLWKEVKAKSVCFSLPN